jgi:hypothetical protein
MRKNHNQEPYGLNPIWLALILITIIALCFTACASKRPRDTNGWQHHKNVYWNDTAKQVRP